ncbi:hypothetical protein ACFPM7_00765 [Actinokineospora guangxiensis]|uniref:Uncharacterized protein n=1 Tax=Actinokineospora guangxiensis TaxID=1490288 RepID=A0ABW0EI43_9PSEU
MFARVAAGSDVEGAREVVRLRALAGSQELLLSLWDFRADAEGPGQWYEVRSELLMADSGSPARAAGLYHFAGPMSPAHVQAADAANDRRIQPAMAEHPGGVRTLVLWQPDAREQLVVVLATSLDSLEEGQRKIASMELLPGEDPALLPGPARVEVYRVVSP